MMKWSPERIFPREAVCRSQVLHSFYDRMKWKEGFEYDYDLPVLVEDQRQQHKDLIKEITDSISYSLESSRPPKSRWHHRQVLRLKLQN